MPASPRPEPLAALERPWSRWSLRTLAVALLLLAASSALGLVPLGRLPRTIALVGGVIALPLGWRRVREAAARLQTVVLLTLIYVIGVGPVALWMGLARADLLDLRTPRASLWRRRAPLPPDALARSMRRWF